MFRTYKEEITTSAEQFKKLSKAVAVMLDHAKETFVSTKTAHKVQYNRLNNEKNCKLLNPYIDVKNGKISHDMFNFNQGCIKKEKQFKSLTNKLTLHKNDCVISKHDRYLFKVELYKNGSIRKKTFLSKHRRIFMQFLPFFGFDIDYGQWSTNKQIQLKCMTQRKNNIKSSRNFEDIPEFYPRLSPKEMLDEICHIARGFLVGIYLSSYWSLS